MSHGQDAETQGTDREFLNKTTSLIIDKAIVVHSKLGPGLLESVYRTCLTHELRKAGAKVAAEQVVLCSMTNCNSMTGTVSICW